MNAGRPEEPRRAGRDDEFINPYNFVSTPARGERGDLGDRRPEGHDAFHHDRYSGSIPIVLITRTPLLLPDHPHAEAASNNAPKRVGTRRRGTGVDSPVLLNGSTVKGALRAAFEAITNSRMGVISSRHQLPVAIRQNAGDVQRRAFAPAIVTGAASTDGMLTVIATRRLSHRDHPDLEPLPAPLVPVAKGAELARQLGLASADELDNQEVDAWVHLQLHPQPQYAMWRVSDIAPIDALPLEPTTPPNPEWIQSQLPAKVRGRLLWTHSTFPLGGSRKANERLVVSEVLAGSAVAEQLHGAPVKAAAAEKFAGIVSSYVAAHEHDTDRVRRHNGSYVWDSDRWRLREGRTLYVELDPRSGAEVVGLFPAIIGREPFGVAPLDMIAGEHRIATAFDELSPADRVFGWVHPDARTSLGPNAYRGKLRVDPPEVDEGPDVTVHAEPVWLCPLNEPKVEQYRFYTGGPDQQPLADGARRRANDGYRVGGALRGRKFYLAQPDTHGDDDYWTPNGASLRSADGRRRHREYLTPNRNRPNVTTSVTSWVPHGVTFRTTLWVENLSWTELGALLWLLALPERAVFGVGFGKPLGFGSVRIEAGWENVELYSRDGLVERYRSLTTKPLHQLTQDVLRQAIADYREVLDQAGLRQVRDEFLDVAMGFTGAPIHYPRVGDPDGQPSGPQEKLYEWFVENERGRRRALPGLGAESPPTLPYLPPPQSRAKKPPGKRK